MLVSGEGFLVRVDDVAVLRVFEGDVEKLHRGFGRPFRNTLAAYIVCLLDELAGIQVNYMSVYGYRMYAHREARNGCC